MRISRLIVSCGLLLAAFLFLQVRSYGDLAPANKPLRDFPSSIAGWQAREFSPFDDKSLHILKLNDYTNLRFVGPQGQSLWLYIGYWSSQRKGAQIHSPKNCLPGSGWEPVEDSKITVPLGPPYSPITINSYLLQRDRERQLVLYWYQSRGTVSAAELSAKIQMVKNSLLYGRSDGAIVRVISPVHGSVAETTEMLVRYVQGLYPVLLEFLPQ